MSGPDYQVIDHTADLALRIRARDLPGLMTGAVQAMLSEMFEGYIPYPEARGRAVTLEADGVDPESLLVSLLNEVLYRVEVDREVPVHLEVGSISAHRVSLVARAVPAARAGLEQTREIKAATFHGLTVAGRAGGALEATIIFDL